MVTRAGGFKTLGVATKTNRVIKGTSAKVGVLFISTKGGILNERNMELIQVVITAIEDSSDGF